MGAKHAKKYSYSYTDCEKNGKSVKCMVPEILEDPDFPSLTELRIGDWGNSYDDSCQDIIDAIVAQPEKFSHIRKLFIGDMDYEECEVSWIIQGNYSRLWAALPGLKSLAIKGSTDLQLGDICHEGLEELEIICGGLGMSEIQAVQNAKLPNLKKLLLYIGVEDYGFDGDEDTVSELLEKADFPNLKYLGIVDSEIQDELAKAVLSSKFMPQIETLDLSLGTLTDKGGELLLQKLPEFPNIKKLDVHYHYLSDGMVQKLENLPLETDVSEQNEPDVYDGETYMNAMLTE